MNVRTDRNVTPGIEEMTSPFLCISLIGLTTERRWPLCDQAVEGVSQRGVLEQGPWKSLQNAAYVYRIQLTDTEIWSGMGIMQISYEDSMHNLNQHALQCDCCLMGAILPISCVSSTCKFVIWSADWVTVETKILHQFVMAMGGSEILDCNWPIYVRALPHGIIRLTGMFPNWPLLVATAVGKGLGSVGWVWHALLWVMRH